MSAESISAGAAIAAAVIALAALALTYHQARNAARRTELQRQIVEDSAQPYVWADLRIDPRQGQSTCAWSVHAETRGVLPSSPVPLPASSPRA